MRGRTRDSETIRSRFLEELQNNGIGPVHLSDERYRDSILRTMTEVWFTQVGFIYVHVRSEDKGFWGCQEGVLDELTVWSK
jgi:hypothetical protein